MHFYEINQTYIQNIHYDQIRIENLNNIRVIKINGCQTFEDGYNVIIRHQFNSYFLQHQHLFVIVIKSENFNEENIPQTWIEDFSNWFGTTRPLIIFFQNHSGSKVLYKNYGSGQMFYEIPEFNPDNVPQVVDFQSLLLNLRDGNFGSFIDTFEGITINRPAKDLMNMVARNKDYLTIRFMHLFDQELKPNAQIIEKILREDFLKSEIGGLSSIYDQSLTINMTIGNNLLMMAVELNIPEAVELLINAKVCLNTINWMHEYAADIAYRRSHFNILSMLIHANSRYPRELRRRTRFIEEINELQNLTLDIHKNITNINEENNEEFERSIDEIVQVLKSNRHIKYWYTIFNQSAATTAILNCKFLTYERLLREQLCIGPYEDIDDIKNAIDESSWNIITQINAAAAHNIQRDPILTLRSNTVTWQMRGDMESPEPLIEEVYQILYQNPFTQILLRVIAVAFDFRIILDFNRTSIDAIDFTSSFATKAAFYLDNFHIYLGALDLLDEITKYRAIGILAHEIAHFSFQLVYENLCKPYRTNETWRKQIYRDILKEYCNFINNEDLIDLVYHYPRNRQHAELIVCVPQMAITCANDQDRWTAFTQRYGRLVDNYIISLQEMNTQIQHITGKFYGRVRFEHQYWIKKWKRERIVRYSLVIGIVLAISAVVGLVLMVMGFDPCINYSTHCTWNILSENYRQKVLNSNILYQTRQTCLELLIDGNYKALEALTDDELRNPAKIKVNGHKYDLGFKYFERKFLNLNNDHETSCKYMYGGVKCKFVYPSFCMKTFEQIILNSANYLKIYLLSSEPASGKTTTLINIAIEKLSEATVKWIAYLDFKHFTKLGNMKHDLLLPKYKNLMTWSSDNVTNFLIDAHEATLSPFEREIFKYKFRKGEVILFMDHIDSIFIGNKILTRNFLKSTMKNFRSGSEIWIGTRSSFGYEIQQIIQERDKNFTSQYSLLPLYCEAKRNFLIQQLEESKQLSQIQINMTIDKIYTKILKITDIFRNTQNIEVDNIGLLQIIAIHTGKSIKSNASDININKILDDYVQEIVANKLWKDYLISKNVTKTERDSRDKTLKIVALWIIKTTYGSDIKDVEFQELIKDFGISALNVIGSNESSWNYSSFEMSLAIETGILKVNKGNVSFLHLVNFEHYVALYIIDEFFNKIKEQDLTTPLFKQKLMLLFNIFKDKDSKYPVVQRSILSFILENQHNSTTKIIFKTGFGKTFKKLYMEFIKNSDNNVTDIIIQQMVDIFKDDEEMVRIYKECETEHKKLVELYKKKDSDSK